MERFLTDFWPNRILSQGYKNKLWDACHVDYGKALAFHYLYIKVCYVCYVCEDSETTAYVKYADTFYFWLIKMLLQMNFNSSVTKKNTKIILRLSLKTQLEN